MKMKTGFLQNIKPKRSDLERQLRTGRRGSDDGRPTHIERL